MPRLEKCGAAVVLHIDRRRCLSCFFFILMKNRSILKGLLRLKYKTNDVSKHRFFQHICFLDCQTRPSSRSIYSQYGAVCCCCVVKPEFKTQTTTVLCQLKVIKSRSLNFSLTTLIVIQKEIFLTNFFLYMSRRVLMSQTLVLH